MTEDQEEEYQPVLAAFGNPLLDIIVPDEEGRMVQTFNLQPDIAQEVDTVALGLYELANKRDDVEFSAGGCALNTVRVFQWLTGVTHSSVFLGGLGQDSQGDLLQRVVEADGVMTSLARQPPHLPTGHCIALVRGAERTLCANLGAANSYRVEDLWTGNNLTTLHQTKVIYVEGYFLSHSPDAARELALFAQKNKKTFIFNLCGEYVCEDIKYVENVLKILPYVDIMFGNRSEFDVFINTVEAKLETSSLIIKNLRAMITGEGVENLEMKIENICESPVRSKPRSLIVVVTEGYQPVQCYTIGEKLRTVSVPVPPLDKTYIKDTIGAGDSFIAGFISVYIRRGSLKSCIEYAIWTAQRMIQQVGVSLPASPPGRQHLLHVAFKKKIKRSKSCGQDSPNCNINIDRKKIKS